jgi:dienelactone hydrolase
MIAGLAALLLLALVMLPSVTTAQAASAGMEWVSFDSAPVQPDQAPVTLRGLLARPDGDGPFPAAVFMHGCSGMLTASGALASRFRGWTTLLVEQGFVVLLADSFNPRGIQQECTVSPQPVSQTRDRPGDARGALAFLQAQRYVDPARVALIGWSHGGGSTLATIVGPLPDPPESEPPVPVLAGGPWFRTAVAFYPGCVTASRPARVASSAPLLILQGDADNWTPPEPCRRLVDRATESIHPIELKLYEGAYHAFDEPNSPLHTRTDVPLAGVRGQIYVGTDPAARADALQVVPAFLSQYLGS